jgi:light-regulated signal transduction histidine kinase (bacteriophytochrome)
MHEGWRVRKDGTKFWGSIVITCLHDEAGNVIGFSKVTRDLTARKKAEENLRQYAHNLELKNKELDEKNKELESFSYVASHDLQEPLRKILVFSTRIANQENFSEKSRDYQNRIINACNRMQMLIDALLTYSHANTNTIKFEETDLNIMLEEVKRDLSELIDDNAARIDSTPLPTLKVMPLQFQQLFHNILSNAIKYRNKDITPHISITASVVANDMILLSTKKEAYKISIADNGIGFEQQYASRIFELFQRLHGKTEYAGTGVGLAICKRIVQNHNGVITAESEFGKGATFHIYIPKD